MAISPFNLEEAYFKSLSEFEKEIDKRLSNYKITRGNSINIVPPKGMTQSHFAKIADNYIKAGWTKVEWVTNWRYGDFIKFKY